MPLSQAPLAPLTRIPAEILAARDYEALAEHFIAPATLAYIAGGSGEEQTLRANRRAFEHVEILPRLLPELSRGHTRQTLLGQDFPHPILLAPVAYQKLVHPQGEIDTARGAAAMDACLVSSTLATCPLEEIAASTPGNKWFQLYFQPTRTATVDLVKRAEMAGYSALMVTLDSSIKSPSRRATRAGFAMPAEIGAVNLERYPAPPQVELPAGQSVIFQGVMADAPSWDELRWLRDQTCLPVLVKGVLRPTDAEKLKAMGIAGAVVSNHGGRALDGVPASLRLLPAIRRSVGAEFPLLLDSGIRSGSDIFKALALGANAVLIGRLQLYALSVAGALGVAHLLRTLREELELCMAQAGCATLNDISPDMIYDSRKEASPC